MKICNSLRKLANRLRRNRTRISPPFDKRKYDQIKKHRALLQIVGGDKLSSRFADGAAH